MKKGWEIKKLGEVCDFVRGLTYSKNDEVNYSNNAVLRSNNIDPISLKLNLNEIKYINDSIQIAQDKIVQEGTIMICTANGSKSHLGKVAYIDKNYGYAFGGFMGLLKPKESVIPIYLYYSLITPIYKDYISKLSDGVNINNLKFSDLSIYSIPIPPIQEQEEIVERLDKGFELIDSLKETAKKNLDNAKELFQSVLREELSPKEGWETKTLGEAGTTLTGQTPPTKDKDNFGNYIPFVKPADFFNGELNYLNEGLSEKGMKFSRVSKKGSTLMVCIGATIGKTAFTEIDVTSNQQINSIYPSKDFFPKFIYYYLISKDFYNQVIENASQATLPIINKSKWESLTISFPKSIKEQEEIVNRLDRIKGYCEELEGNYKRVLELCEELKQGLLREAFSY